MPSTNNNPPSSTKTTIVGCSLPNTPNNISRTHGRTKVYLAGKMRGYRNNDWRRELISNPVERCSILFELPEGDSSNWEETRHITHEILVASIERKQLIASGFESCGPFRTGCKHGCYANSTAHGAGVNVSMGCGSGGMSLIESNRARNTLMRIELPLVS